MAADENVAAADNGSWITYLRQILPNRGVKIKRVSGTQKTTTGHGCFDEVLTLETSALKFLKR